MSIYQVSIMDNASKEELFFMSMAHFRVVMYSSDYTPAQKEEELELFNKDFAHVKDDPLIQRFYKCTIGEWDNR